MIINNWSGDVYFVRDLDNDRMMCIGTLEECKEFMVTYNEETLV